MIQLTRLKLRGVSGWYRSCEQCRIRTKWCAPCSQLMGRYPVCACCLSGLCCGMGGRGSNFGILTGIDN